jgi:Tfp pilus assembly protein PilF
MRLKTNATVRRTMYLALGGMLFCPGSSVHAQGMASRAPAGIRSANELSGSNPFDSIALISSKPANVPRTTPLAETVSVKELRVPAPAVKEFQRSLKAIRSGDFQSAAEHLRKAIQIDPDFVQAHDNLGLSYVQLSQYENAVSEFQQAIALDTNVQESHRNLGLGLFLLRRYPEAELATRQALQLNPRGNYARYTLGRILAAEGSGSAEAEQLLRQSIVDFPDARLPLAQVLLNKGSNEEAAAELRTYLKSPDANPAKKQVLQCRLAQITGSDVSAACGTR